MHPGFEQASWKSCFSRNSSEQGELAQIMGAKMGFLQVGQMKTSMCRYSISGFSSWDFGMLPHGA